MKLKINKCRKFFNVKMDHEVCFEKQKSAKNYEIFYARNIVEE
jgi:hypothetical protein